MKISNSYFDISVYSNILKIKGVQELKLENVVKALIYLIFKSFTNTTIWYIGAFEVNRYFIYSIKYYFIEYMNILGGKIILWNENY